MSGIRLGKVIGFDVNLDTSWFIILFLVLWSFTEGVFPAQVPGLSRGLYLAMGTAGALLFFLSLLAHELSHAVVGRAQGISVRSITLFLFGGVAHMEDEPPSPKAEFLMAVVGPVVSIVIGISAVVVAALLAADAASPPLMQGTAEEAQRALASMGPLETLLIWLGPVNVFLGLFNLVPGFPLDGGRVLRSAIWAITGNLMKATRWASRGGQLVAWGLMAIGAMNLFAGAVGQGIWLLLIGWFLNNAAQMSYQQVVIQQAFENVAVSRVMRTQLERVPPELSIEDFVREHLMATDQRAFPVESDGRLRGLVCFEDVRKVPQSDWPTTAVERIMTPTAALSTLPPEAAAGRVLKELARRDVDQIPIVDGDRLVGMVRRGDLVKWLALQQPGAMPSAVSRS